MALFGTDGIRARAGEGPLAPDKVRLIGFAIGRLLRRQPGIFSSSEEVAGNGTVLVGRDTRTSGPVIEAQLTSGLMAFGTEVWTAGVLPTPGVAYLTRAWSCTLGIVISASHNPPEDNGIKIFSSDGYKIPDAAESAIESLYTDPGLKHPEHSHTSVYRRVNNRSDEYLMFLREQLGGSLAGMKIVVDCANGAAHELAPKLLRSLGAEVVAVNVDADGANINRDAAVLTPEALQRRVLDENADLGAAFDGDADRCIFVDDTGMVRDGDHILAICSSVLPDKAPVVSTVMANYGLEQWLAERGHKLLRTSVGDRWVSDEMRRSGALLGGEQSGHVIFMDASPTGDGMLTMMRVLRLMREKGKALSALCEGFRKAPQVLVNVQVRSKPPLDTVPQVADAIRDAESSLSGRVLVRYSGTEPLCRVMVEGTDEVQVRRVAGSLADAVRRHLG